MEGRDSESANAETAAERRLSDYVSAATIADAVVEEDGSTTVYLPLRRVERFSILPTSERTSWFGRFTRKGGTARGVTSEAGVRRVPRGGS